MPSNEELFHSIYSSLFYNNLVDTMENSVVIEDNDNNNFYVVSIFDLDVSFKRKWFSKKKVVLFKLKKELDYDCVLDNKILKSIGSNKVLEQVAKSFNFDSINDIIYIKETDRKNNIIFVENDEYQRIHDWIRSLKVMAILGE